MNGTHSCRIDLSGCIGKACLLERLYAALAFPANWGRNWDALADGLCDLSWLPEGGVALVFEHAGDLQRASAKDFAVLLAVLQEAEEFWVGQGVPFRFFGLPQIQKPGETASHGK